jgi:uncharacterized protein YkwD
MGSHDSGVKYYWRLLVLMEVLTLLIVIHGLMTPYSPPLIGHSRLHTTVKAQAETYGGDPTIFHPDSKIQSHLDELNIAIDPRLETAAQAILRHVPKAEAMLALESLNYYLNASGAVYWDTEQVFFETEETDDLAVYKKLLSTQTANNSKFGSRIGFAQQWTLFPKLKRKIIALVAHPKFIMDPLARHVVPGADFQIAGRVAPTIGDVSIMTLDEHGHQATIAAQLENGHVSAPLRLTPGQWTIEVVGDTPLGPLPLAQFKLCSGCLSSRVFRERNTQPDMINTSPSLQLIALINQSRARFGLTPMTDNPALRAVASAHSQDMLIHDFVGHRSPTTGEIKQRLKSANLTPSIFGENISRNTSIQDVHRSLMHSVSHRLNILEPSFTDVGLGIEYAEGHWIVTEVFARLDHQVSQL